MALDAAREGGSVILTPRAEEIRHFHLFCGLGGGKKGFNKARAVVGNVHARLRCVGGVDVSQAAINDFNRMGPGRGTVLDLFSREQYRAFHGCEPPDGWREATPDDIRRAAGYEQPHIGFGSAPCKGFSGLLSETKSKTGKYDALNQLALRGLWLALEAWKDDPLEFWLWENVPRIQTRGRTVLDQMEALFEAYGYAFAETTHDCGELGNLAQRRPRFLLVARHREKVPPFLYEPVKRRVRGVGEVIGKLPVPGPDLILPMHRLPRLQWQTWVRLAFVEAGSDWRSLNRLRVADGVLKDYGLLPEREWYRTALGVHRWSDPAGVVTSESRPQNGGFSVADPRSGYTGEYGQIGVKRWDEPSATVSGQSQVGGGPHSIADPRPHLTEGFGGLGVREWDQPSGTIIGVRSPGQGTFSVADPRIPGKPRFNHVFRIVPWQSPSPAVTGGGGPAGGLAVADPRTGYGPSTHSNVLRVTDWDKSAVVVAGGQHPAGGALCVADPRPEYSRDGKDVYKTTGEYGVVPWDAASGSITANGQHDNGRWTVADPREPAGSDAPALPGPKDRLVAVIQALDGTYHRPFTTLELAALQSLVDPDELLELDGESDAAWRERIGNAVPPDAAQAIGEVMATTLLLAWAGETFVLSAMPIWVQPIAVALSVATELIT